MKPACWLLVLGWLVAHGCGLSATEGLVGGANPVAQDGVGGDEAAGGSGLGGDGIVAGASSGDGGLGGWSGGNSEGGSSEGGSSGQPGGGQAGGGAGGSDILNSSFQIVSKLSSKCVDLGGITTNTGSRALRQLTCNQTSPQIFVFKVIAGNVGLLRNATTMQCISVEGELHVQESKLVMMDCSESKGQQWRLERTDAEYRIRNIGSAQCMDVMDASLQDDGFIVQWPCHNNANQHWILQPTP